MNALKLYDAVNWQIQLMGINEQESKLIKTCITRYTPRKAFSDRLTYLFYQACNFVKKALGKPSDWQLAEKAIEKHIYSYVPSPYRQFAKKMTHNQVHFVANKTLQFLVWENERAFSIPKPIKTLVEDQLKELKNKLVVRVKQFDPYYFILVESCGMDQQLYQTAKEVALIGKQYIKLCVSLFKEAKKGHLSTTHNFQRALPPSQ